MGLQPLAPAATPVGLVFAMSILSVSVALLLLCWRSGIGPPCWFWGGPTWLISTHHVLAIPGSTCSRSTFSWRQLTRWYHGGFQLCCFFWSRWANKGQLGRGLCQLKKTSLPSASSPLKRRHTSNSVTPQRSLAGLCYSSQTLVGFTPSLECA